MTDITNYKFTEAINYIKSLNYNILEQNHDNDGITYKIVQVPNDEPFCHVLYFENYDKFITMLNIHYNNINNRALLYYTNEESLSYMVLEDMTLVPGTRTVIL
jgi:hypothetical protein